MGQTTIYQMGELVCKESKPCVQVMESRLFIYRYRLVESNKYMFHWVTTFTRSAHIKILRFILCPWWRHQMETFSALLAICAENSPVPGEFPAQRPVTRSFDVFFDLRRNKRLSKQSWGWWFETLSRPLWRHCNGHWLLESNKQMFH